MFTDPTQYRSCFLRCHFSYLNLSLPVLNAVLQVHSGVLLVHELQWIGHVGDLQLQGLLLLLQVASAVDLITGLLDVLLGAHLLILFSFHVSVDALLHAHGVLQLLLQGVQGLHGFARVQFQGQQLLISLIDVLHMFLVFNLELVEVDELEVVSHLLLVLDLRLSLRDLRLQRRILKGQLADQSVLSTLLVLHVFHQLLCIVFASSSVFSSGEETTEVESLLSNLCNGQIRALQDGLESLEQCLRAISTALNTLFECFQLGVGDLVLLFGCEPSLVVDEGAEELLLLYPLLLRHLRLTLIVRLLLLLF